MFFLYTNFNISLICSSKWNPVHELMNIVSIQLNVQCSVDHWPHVVSAHFLATDIKAGPALMDSLLPSTLSSIANLSSCMKDGKDEDGGKCGCSVVRQCVTIHITEMPCLMKQTNGPNGCVCLCIRSGIELDKLDAEMIKLLAWQRIQQLFPPKAPSTPLPLATAAAPKTPSPHPDSKTWTRSGMAMQSVSDLSSCWLSVWVFYC